MKRHVLPLLILLCIFVGGFYILANTTLVVSVLAPKTIRYYFTDMEIESLKVTRQTFSLPDTLHLHDVSLKLSRRGKTYSFQCEKLSFPDFRKLWHLKQQIRMSGEKLDAEWDLGKVQGVDFKLILTMKEKSLIKLDSILKGESVKIAQYQTKEFSARARGNDKQIQIYEISANGYGGKIKGQVQIDHKPRLAYIVWLEFMNLNTQELEPVHQEFFSKMQAGLTGTFRVIGNTERISLLDANFKAQQGGILTKELIDEVIKRIADSAQKNKLKVLVAANPKLPFDEGAFHLRNASDYVATVTFNIVNKKADLNLIENIGVDVQEGFKDFLFRK